MLEGCLQTNLMMGLSSRRLSPGSWTIRKVLMLVTVSNIMNYSRRSRIFLKRRPLSCEVPSRRDSVGGGVVAEFLFSVASTSRRDSVGGGG